MLEPVLKGLVEWLYEMMVDIMSYASGELLGVMSMDLSYFESTAPIISEIVSVFIALGWALLIGNLVFQCLKAMMSGAGFEAEDPKILFLRTFVFAFLLLASRQICDIGSSITGTVIDMLKLPNSITVITPDESMFSLGSGAKWLLVIIVGVVLMVQMVKLLFEIGERYVITSVLTFFAPLAFAMGGSKNTNDIFKGWVRMYCSMLVMMIMNIVFLKLIMSAMSQMAAGGVLVWLVFVVALTRVARKIDSHIGKIGLNPAQTGNGIGSRLPGVMTAVAVRTMGSLVSKSMANAKGGSDGKTGRNGNTGRGGSASRPGGNPRPNNPISGGGYNGGSSVNNIGTATSVNSGTHINGSNSSTNISGSSSNTERQTGQAVRGNANVPKPNNAPNVLGIVKNGGATVNQGVQNGGQQGAVHESVQNKGNVQRPPIPRNTAGGYKNGNASMSSVVNGGNANSANLTMPNNRGGDPNVSGANKGNSVNIGKKTANVPPAVSSNINHNTNSSGGKASVSTDVTNNSSNVKTATQNGGSISGQSKNTMNIGGNSGNVSVSGGNSGGNNINYSEHTGSEHFTDRSSQRFMEMQTNKSMQINSRKETSEKRVNHEYKHGRYNPAAANRKVKKSYYQKDNQGGARANNTHKMNRGENNRNKRKR